MLRRWIKRLQAKTAGGAYLFYDGELYKSPKWLVGPEMIAFRVGNCTCYLWEFGSETELQAYHDLRKRLRVLVEA